MLPRTRSPSTRSGRLVAAIGVTVALAAAVGVVMWSPWHGPVILSLSTGHGINAGDLPVVLLVALAIFIAASASLHLPTAWHPLRRVSAARWVGPASAMLLGGLLVTAAAVGLSDRGPMLPTGGGTFDGKVQFVAGRSANPIGTWSYVALTYDGSRLRLFVDGAQVATRAATGTIERTQNPLWLGGNHPYGEFFEGLIDEARVYDQAIGEAEIRADMATPVRAGNVAQGQARLAAEPPTAPSPVAALVAAYSFDEGSGTSVTDDSGNGNVGTIAGAAWAPGRFGNALSFDGADDIVRVPASTSLSLGSELTVSAWIRPTASQTGWRTIIQRERDAFFLDAGSGIQGIGGRADDVLAGSVVVAAAWFFLVMAGSGGRWLGRRRRAWALAAGLLLLGCLVDAVLAPSASLLGPTLLAVWFAASASDRVEAAIGWLVAVGLTTATLAARADVAGIDVRMQRDDGGLARTGALGVTMLVIGLVTLRRDPVRRQHESVDPRS
jgi:hypothetical protein